jgi:hypothetical protein
MVVPLSLSLSLSLSVSLSAPAPPPPSPRASLLYISQLTNTLRRPTNPPCLLSFPLLSSRPSSPSSNIVSGGGKASLLQDVDLGSSSSSAPATVEEVELGMSGGATGGGVKNMLPPAWVDNVEAVERDIAAIDSKIESLQELHKSRLMVKFDDTNEDQQDQNIERTAMAITAIFRRAEKALKTISADTDFSAPQQTKGEFGLFSICFRKRKMRREGDSWAGEEKKTSATDGCLTLTPCLFSFLYFFFTRVGAGAQAAGEHRAHAGKPAAAELRELSARAEGVPLEARGAEAKRGGRGRRGGRRF